MNPFKIKFRILQGKPEGKNLVFPCGEYYFGRGMECQIRPNSDLISRQHCLLRVTSEGAFLRDLGSRNGTLINGVLVTRERRLEDGDKVQLGPMVFEVLIDAVFARVGRPDQAPLEVSDIGDDLTPTSPESMSDTQDHSTFKPPPE